jgi:hypothetical protein
MHPRLPGFEGMLLLWFYFYCLDVYSIMNAFTIQWLECVLHFGSLEESKANPALRRTWKSELMAETMGIDTLRPSIHVQSDQMKETQPDTDVEGEEAILEALLKSTSISSPAAKAPDQACKLNISLTLTTQQLRPVPCPPPSHSIAPWRMRRKHSPNLVIVKLTY